MTILKHPGTKKPLVATPQCQCTALSPQPSLFPHFHIPHDLAPLDRFGRDELTKLDGCPRLGLGALLFHRLFYFVELQERDQLSIRAVGLENSASLSHHPFAPGALSQLVFGPQLRYAILEDAATL